MNGFDTLVYLS